MPLGRGTPEADGEQPAGYPPAGTSRSETELMQ